MTAKATSGAPRRGWVVRALQIAVFVNLVLLIWVLRFRGSDDDPQPVIQVEQVEFSLDAVTVGTAEIEPVYVLEHRGRPNHRVLRFDPATGEMTTVFSIPEGALIYSIALRPGGAELAIAYTEDFDIDGNGLYLLDLTSNASAAMDGLVAERTNLFLTDIAWSPDGGTIWATEVDQRGDGEDAEILSVVSIDRQTGVVRERITDAIDPAVGSDSVAYLQVEEDQSRRSIGLLDRDTDSTRTITVLDGRYDLDHLLYTDLLDTDLLATEAEQLLVSALIPTGDTGVTIGTPAAAHGSHSVPSEWIAIDILTGDTSGPLNAEPTVVWDAAVQADGTIVFTTREGLSAFTGATAELIESRALRSIAG